MKKMSLLLLVALAACASPKKQQKPASAFTPCIEQIIKTFAAAPKQNPPRSIYSYIYKNKMVYYVTPVCCDQFSDLYDENCKLIGHPDGGFTGKGDGLLLDFTSSKSAEKLIWKDGR